MNTDQGGRWAFFNEEELRTLYAALQEHRRMYGPRTIAQKLHHQVMNVLSSRIETRND